MPRFDLTRLRMGLLGNLGAQGAALVVQLIVALVTVPVFAGTWGLETFGVWLLLLTLPACLTLADLGYPAAAAVEMATLVARGERAQAQELYRQATGMACTGAAVVLLLATGLLFGLGEGSLLPFPAARDLGVVTTAVLLAGFAMAGIVTRALFAALRATGHNASGTYIIAATALLNVILAAICALAGFGLPGAAAGYLVGELIGTLAMALAVRRLVPDMRPALLPRGYDKLAPLGRPALAIIFVLIGQTLVLQGATLALGFAAGAAAVPAFVAARTLARLGIQSVGVVNLAVIPEMTFARSRGDGERVSDLVAANLSVAVVLLVPGSIMFAIFGSAVIDLWSGSVIAAPAGLVALMALMMLAGGLWGPLAGFLSAENRQGEFAYAFTFAALFGVALAGVLSLWLAATGAAAAMLGVDAAMLAWTYHHAHNAGFFDGGSLRRMPARAIAFVRERMR